MAKSQDILALLRGVQTVVRAGIREEEKEIQRLWNNSSVRVFISDSFGSVTNKVKNSGDVLKVTSDGVERLATIVTGVNQFVTYNPKGKTKEGAK